MVQYRCLGTRRPGAAVTSPIFMTRAWHAASATPERAALWRKSVAHPQPKGHRVKIRRQLMASMAAVLVTAGLGFAVIHADPVQAHGVTMIPGSRTWLCYQDGLRPNGEIIAYNPACASAIAANGT